MTIEELVTSDLHKDAFHIMFDVMRRHAFNFIEYSFEGSGDSGNLETDVTEWQGLHDDKVAPKDVNINPPAKIKEPNGRTMDGKGNWVQCYDDVEAGSLDKLGYHLASIVLNNSEYDWYNNDGGFGSIQFKITEEGKNHVYLDMNVREVTSSNYPDELSFDHG